MSELDDFSDDEDFLNAVSTIDKSDNDHVINNNNNENERGVITEKGKLNQEEHKEELDHDTIALQSKISSFELEKITSGEDENLLFQSIIEGIGRLPTPHKFPFPFPPYSIQVSTSMEEGEGNCWPVVTQRLA